MVTWLLVRTNRSVVAIEIEYIVIILLEAINVQLAHYDMQHSVGFIRWR